MKKYFIILITLFAVAQLKSQSINERNLLVRNCNELSFKTQNLQAKFHFIINDSSSKIDSLTRPFFIESYSLTNALKKNLDTTNSFLVASNENFSASQFNYFLTVSTQASMELSSYEINDPITFALRLEKLNNEVENIKYMIQHPGRVPPEVQVSVTILDSLSRPQEGWVVTGYHVYTPLNTVDLKRTNNATGTIRPGNIEIKCINGNRKVIKPHFIKASDPSTWKIIIYLNDYNL